MNIKDYEFPKVVEYLGLDLQKGTQEYDNALKGVNDILKRKSTKRPYSFSIDNEKGDELDRLIELSGSTKTEYMSEIVDEHLSNLQVTRDIINKYNK